MSNSTPVLDSKWISKPKSDTSVVFLHGILSDSITCWTVGDAYWPDIVARDEQLKGVGLYVFSYRSDAFSANYSLGDAVEELNAYLELDGVISSPKLVFVCHSMGGIVARQFIVTRQSTLIEKRTRIGLFLVASPSLGSGYANLVSTLARALGNSQADALRFADNNTWLNDLDRNFLNLKESGKLSLHGQELVEDQFFIMPALFRRPVVQAFSGAHYFGEALKIPFSDHFTIAKPSGADAIQHRLLQRFVMTSVQPQPITEGQPESASSVPEPVPGAPVKVGIGALNDLTRNPRIREAALPFKSVFAMASVQIMRVTGYKSLHDQLHELDAKVYSPLQRAAPDFPSDEDAKAEINEYRIEFDDITEKLKGIAANFNSADTTWISVLEAVLKDFHTSLQRDEALLLKDVLKRLDRLLTLHPPRINAQLNEAARALQLAELVGALREFQAGTARLSPLGSEPVRRLTAGVEALDRMEKNFSKLVKRHDDWQEFDANLHAMEKNQTAEDFLGWWPDLQQLIDRVQESYGPEPWILSFLDDCALLHKEIQAGELSRIRRSFKQVQKHVSRRFYNTDAELKAQCDELRTVGQSLASLEVNS
jgi:hypothetical protein